MAIEEVDGKTFYVDDETGGRKEVKLERFDLVPIGPLTELARHYGRGALKYADRNWELGYPWALSYASLVRHLTQWWAGEDVDPETGSSHMVAVAWHAFALLEFINTHPEMDNRPTTPDVEPLEEELVSPQELREIVEQIRKDRFNTDVSRISIATVPEVDTWDGTVNDLDIPVVDPSFDEVLVDEC